MSFGLLKQFKQSPKNDQALAKKDYFKHLIVGNDLSAVLKFVQIKKQFPGDSVAIISDSGINKDLIQKNHSHCVSQLRSSKVFEFISSHNENIKIIPQEKDPVFYKDGKFHEFGSRTKPMELKLIEDIFLSRSYSFNIEKIFEEEAWDSLDSTLLDNVKIKILDSIEKVVSNDLVQIENWSLGFRDFSFITCENLYFSLGPDKFLFHLKDRSSFTSELIDFCSQSKSVSTLNVTWLLSKNIENEDRTLLIPQSMTHEWGHFIVEFSKYDSQLKTQQCQIMFILENEEIQTEDIATKIKLMKRVMDRVFPNIEDSIKEEFIRLDSQMFVQPGKKTAQEQIFFDYPHLRFIGQSSSLPDEWNEEKYFARSLLSFLFQEKI